MRPDGLPIWTSEALPGHLHVLTCAQVHANDGARYWAASQLHLPSLAYTGYDGTGRGIHTRSNSSPTVGQLAVDNRAYDTLARLCERGFVLLTAADTPCATPLRTLQPRRHGLRRTRTHQPRNRYPPESCCGHSITPIYAETP